MKRSFEGTKDEPNLKRQMPLARFVGNIPNTLHYSLHREDKSWIETFTLPDAYRMEDYSMIWNMHPPERTIFQRYKMIGTKELEYPFFSQSYGRAGSPAIPAIFIPWLNFVNIKTNYTVPFQQPFNEILVHWLENGDDYCPGLLCGDSEKGMKRDAEGNTITISIGFGTSRPHSFKSKIPDCDCGDLRITMNHEMGLVMGGLLQSTHNHTIKPIPNVPVGKHIMLTFRMFQ